ncbi:MAG: 3-keto-5-aminohexanoate cleavage protein [Chloroflexota bacterium]|nr:3-keto-5-aminohexanoate cleavage protein [Chloroflexota bacterium]
MLIQACLNGSREPGEHSALPLSPQELAREARRVVNAGAESLHMHPRRPDGSQALDPQNCGVAVIEVRAHCPAIPIGLSTAAWIEPDLQQRLKLIWAWEELPDFASVNFSEEGAADVCALLVAKGIGIEAGLATLEDVELLLALGIADRCLRLLIEPGEPAIAAARANVEAIVQYLDAATVRTPRLLHGSEATAWPLLVNALQRGYATRIGFEDTLTLPNGSPARDNAQLVALARELR